MQDLGADRGERSVCVRADRADARVQDAGRRTPRRSTSTAAPVRIGHPVGASGARLVGTLALEMRRRGVAVRSGDDLRRHGARSGDDPGRRVSDEQAHRRCPQRHGRRSRRRHIDPTPGVERAFRSVPRHAFLPAAVRPRRSIRCSRRSIETDDPRARVYRRAGRAHCARRPSTAAPPASWRCRSSSWRRPTACACCTSAPAPATTRRILAELVGERGTVVGVEYDARAWREMSAA